MAQIVLKLAFFGLVVLAVVFEVIADIFFKKWSINAKNVLFYAGLFLYFIGTIFWAVSLRYLKRFPYLLF